MRQLSCETTISIFPNHPNIEPCDRIPRVGMLNYSVKQRYYQTSAFIAYSRPMRLFFQIQVPIFSSSLSERIQAQIFTSSSSERLRAVAFSKFQRVPYLSCNHSIRFTSCSGSFQTMAAAMRTLLSLSKKFCR